MSAYAGWAVRCAAIVAATVMGAGLASAEKIRVGKSVSTAFTLAIADVGNDYGIWKQVGLEVEVIAFKGDAQMQQALTSGSVDFGLGSGPGLGYAAKGVPAKGVAAFASVPGNMCILIPPDSPIKSVEDLKGKKIGVTSAGSLTDWLVRELSRQKGWGPDGITAVPMGSMRTRLAAIKNGEIQGTVQETSNGYDLEEEGVGKVFLTFGDIVPKFITHVAFARNDIIEKNPDQVRRFLKGLFLSIKYMKEHKADTVKSIARILEARPSVIERTYAPTMAMLSDDGHWDPEALKVIQRSLRELGILDFTPDISKLYNPDFAPVKL